MLFHYQDAFYREYGAVTRKQCGKGSIYYLGCGLEEELLRQVMAKIWEEQGICCEESRKGWRSYIGEVKITESGLP